MYELNKELAEFYGILLGDGCISKFYSQNRNKEIIRIDGHGTDDIEYYKYLQELIEKITNRRISVKRRNKKNAIFITFSNKEFSKFLNSKLNFPYGKKKGMVISDILLRKDLINKVLRGLFDTDGSIYFTKNNWKRKRRTYPIIEISSHNDNLIDQLLKILKGLGFKPILSHYKDSIKLHGKKQVIKWMEEIGSNNPYKKSKYLIWEKHGEYKK
jgi:intein/homing endonuclease